MKKKIAKKKKTQPKRQQKIDVVLSSLLNLETQMRELIKKVEQLQSNLVPYYPPAQQDRLKYWPVDYLKYKDVT